VGLPYQGVSVYALSVIGSTTTLRILAASIISLALSMLPASTDFPSTGLIRRTLLQLREPTTVARDILLVGPTPPGDPAQEPRAESARPAEIVWALVEFGADRALLTPGWDDQLAASEDRVVRDLTARVENRLETEFSLIDENIAELFRAIRIGSIKPQEADRFVDELRRLVDASETRIRKELNRRAPVSRETVDDLSQAFGRNRVGRSLSDLAIFLPDYQSAIAVPMPLDRREQGFRRMAVSSLESYIAVKQRLDELLREMDSAGYFQSVNARHRPRVMLDYLETLRVDLRDRPSAERAGVFREAVRDFYATVDDLVDTDLERRLVASLVDELDEATEESINETLSEISSAFSRAREAYRAFMGERDELRRAIRGSLVILAGDEPQENRSQAYRLAVNANSVLVAEHLVAPVGWYRALLLAGAGALVASLLTVFRAGPAAALAPAAIILVTGLFGLLFVTSDIWIQSELVFAVLIAATFASILVAAVGERAADKAIVGIASTRFPTKYVRRAYARGGLVGTATRTSRAVVVVVSGCDDEADSSGERDGAHEIEEFQRGIARKIQSLGGIVLGEDGRTVLAGFGTPMGTRPRGSEKVGGAPTRSAEAACKAALTLVSKPPASSTRLRCGVDIGPITFYSSPIGGYRATGQPIVYARRLCDVAAKHECRVLVGGRLRRLLSDGPHKYGFREIGQLVRTDGDERYDFYELTEQGPPSA
jgi:hypothetical protein